MRSAAIIAAGPSGVSEPGSESPSPARQRAAATTPLVPRLARVRRDGAAQTRAAYVSSRRRRRRLQQRQRQAPRPLTQPAQPSWQAPLSHQPPPDEGASKRPEATRPRAASQRLGGLGLSLTLAPGAVRPVVVLVYMPVGPWAQHKNISESDFAWAVFPVWFLLSTFFFLGRGLTWFRPCYVGVLFGSPGAAAGASSLASAAAPPRPAPLSSPPSHRPISACPTQRRPGPAEAHGRSP